MFDFLSCGFGSVLGGLLTSLFISGGLLAYSTQYTKRGAIETFAIVLCGILFCVLFFQATEMYGAFSSKGIAMDFLSACHLQFGNEINGAELKAQMTTLISENPLISFFIDYGDIEDFDWSQPIKSLRSVVAREYNWFIFRRIAWSVIFIAIAFYGIMLTNDKRGRKRKRRSQVSDDIFNFD